MAQAQLPTQVIVPNKIPTNKAGRSYADSTFIAPFLKQLTPKDRQAFRRIWGTVSEKGLARADELVLSSRKGLGDLTSPWHNSHTLAERRKSQSRRLVGELTDLVPGRASKQVFKSFFYWEGKKGGIEIPIEQRTESPGNKFLRDLIGSFSREDRAKFRELLNAKDVHGQRLIMPEELETRFTQAKSAVEEGLEAKFKSRWPDPEPKAGSQGTDPDYETWMFTKQPVIQIIYSPEDARLLLSLCLENPKNEGQGKALHGTYEFISRVPDSFLKASRVLNGLDPAHGFDKEHAI